MGTIRIDLRFLDRLSVEVTATGVTGHTVEVVDHIHPAEIMAGVPAGSTVTTVTDPDGKKAKKISTSI